jgi:hypothetical protein
MDTKYIQKGPYSKRILATLNLFALVNSILYRINEPGGVHRYHEGGLCLTLPQELHIPVLEECHDSIATGGHQGTDKTYLKLCKRYWWPDYYKITHYWVKSCKRCGSVNRPALQKRKSRMQQAIFSCPCKALNVDAIGPYPEQNKETHTC